MTSRVLVTGGCGFVGANLIRMLAARGYDIRILDDLSTGNADYLTGYEVDLRVGDIRDRALVREVIADCDSVIHLAAKTVVHESIRDPEGTLAVNVVATHNLLQIVAESGVGRFIFASSNAAVGEQKPPVDETKVPKPISPYGASKLAGEAYCHGYHGSHGLGTVALRFANAYGTYSGHKTSVIAKFIGLILDGQPLTIYGDGQQTRDFIFVEDVCDAVVRALESDVAGEVFQVATGIETSVLELVEELGRVTGISPKIVWEPQLPGEIRRNYSSIAKARTMLGFEPKVRLREGLEITFGWLSQQRNA